MPRKLYENAWGDDRRSHPDASRRNRRYGSDDRVRESGRRGGLSAYYTDSRSDREGGRRERRHRPYGDSPRRWNRRRRRSRKGLRSHSYSYSSTDSFSRSSSLDRSNSSRSSSSSSSSSDSSQQRSHNWTKDERNHNATTKAVRPEAARRDHETTDTQQPQRPPSGTRSRGLKRARSFSETGRTYSLPPSPTVPPHLATTGGSTPSRQAPARYPASSPVPDPAPPLYDAAGTAPSSPAEGAPSLKVAKPDTLSQTAPGQSARLEGKSALRSRDSADYVRWLRGERSTTARSSSGGSGEPPTSSARRRAVQQAASGAAQTRSMPHNLTEHWEDVSADKPFLVTTDNAVMEQWRRGSFAAECAGTASSNGDAVSCCTGQACEPEGAPACKKSAESSGTDAAGSHSKPEQEQRELFSEAREAALERARCFREHFDLGRVHPKPPWRICANAEDNHEHPYYVDWLDELNSTSRMGGLRDGESAALEDVIAFYKAAVRLKRKGPTATS